MRERVAARRYAEGFLDFCRENIGVKQGFAELSRLKQIISGNPELKEFLENPEIAFSDKKTFIGRVFKKDFSPEARIFLEFIIKKGRIAQIADIADHGKIIYQRQSGIEKAILTTAQALDEKSLQAVKTRLEKRLQKKLEVEARSDPGLIGGIQAIVGNIVVDGSIKRKLSDLKENLLNIKVN